METATTELPSYPTIYETGGPSCLPAMDASYVPGVSTSLGDPYAPQSYHHRQGSDVFLGAGDEYVDPHGYPYHTTTHLSGSDLYPTCLACGAIWDTLPTKCATSRGIVGVGLLSQLRYVTLYMAFLDA
ncbi:Uncharacterized protein Rs2_44362 [Raphanus sativus]|nr:Uncharacterized protein Rs2_44362 [Raphanus sativus]